MNRKPTLDMEKIARRLGALRRGTVTSRGGYFGALQLAAEVQARFGVPERGGPRSDQVEDEHVEVVAKEPEPDR